MTNEVFIYSSYLLAGVMVFATVHHFLTFLNSPSNNVQLLFTGICLSSFLFALFYAEALKAGTVTEFVLPLKLCLLAAFLTFLFLAWFVVFFTGIRPRYLLEGLTIFFALLSIVNLAEPYSLQYVHINGIHTIHSTMGMDFTQWDGTNGVWAYIAIVGIMVLFAYTLYALYDKYKKNHRSSDLWMLCAVGFYVLSACQSILIRISILDLVDISPYSAVAMVIVMSAVLIQEKGKVESEVSQLKDWQQALLDSADYSIISTNVEGVITSFNAAAQRMLGFSVAEVVGIHTPGIFHDPTEISRRSIELSLDLGRAVLPCFEVFVANAKMGKAEVREWTYIRKNGSRITVSLSVTAIHNSTGEITGFLGIAADLTESKKVKLSLQDSNARYKSLFESAGDSIFLMEGECFIDCNPATLTMFGCTREQIIGEPPYRFSPEFQPDGRSSKEKALEKINHALTGKALTFEWQHCRYDGTPFDAEVTLNVVELGANLHLMAFVRDMTERKRADQLFREVFHASLDAINITKLKDGQYFEVNQAFQDITGYDRDEVIGRTGLELNVWVNPLDRQRLVEVIQREGEVRNQEIHLYRKNGETIWGLISSSIFQLNGEAYLLSITHDITERKISEEKIQHLAFYDTLTNLPNRQLLLNRLQQAMVSSARSFRNAALLFVDLDNFKSLNDTLGHSIGDILLQKVAFHLTSCVREGDTVARLGGDEFVVMLEDLSEQTVVAAEQTKSIGEKILAVLGQMYQLDVHEFRSSASIGATVFNGDQHDSEELLKQADIAMYHAKKTGRNSLHFFDPQMQETINSRVALERELHKALENGQFQLHYQIQVNNERSPLGAEALIRWIHPERGMVSPAEFIPLAEESGLILSIGNWVLETACAQLKLWQGDESTRNLILAVNVSAWQFHQADFVEQVRSIIELHGITPKLLKFELTESLMLEDIDETITTMDGLSKLGVRLSLDDFGTGYSSLQYLKRLPLDQLKIDQSFVYDISTDPSDALIVATIIAMANALELEVIAEGVETQAQHEFLRQRGCNAYQGYLFGKPMPIERLDELIKQS